MKAPAQVLPIARVDRHRGSILAELFKARLTSLVLVTTGVGYYVGSPARLDLLGLLHTLVGTALLAAGAAALNQWIERDFDARMRRTQDRPLPAGRIRPETALGIGLLSAVSGLVYLAGTAGSMPTLLGAITLLIYICLYTPLKRVTPLNTVVGAIPGALPPLLGWTAARGTLDIEGWSLFAILAFWQLPHFLAIAWLYREDYQRAGFAMLTTLDPDGNRTSAHALAHTLGLLAMSLGPFVLGLTGVLYLAGAGALGGLFLAAAWRFRCEASLTRARHLFYASILYLPLLLGLMVLDKLG